MRGNNFIYAFYIIMVFLVTGCAGSTNPVEHETEEPDDMIRITQKQFESDNMKIGELTMQLFEEQVICNGYVAAPPNGMAQISTQISGIVKTIHCALGDYVKKGQVLCRLSSIELIALQQDFAETSANLKRLKADWERSKALYDEKIGAEKDFMAIENQYKIVVAKYQSLKLKLELLELNVSKIENGELYSSFPVLSPVNGHVTSQNIILGQFIEQQKNLMEIVDVNQLQLQLSVFENDIKYLKVGQKIQFFSLGDPNAIHDATIISIGKIINMETKTIKCLAKIEKSRGGNFVNNAYIEAKISINKAKAKALPSDAILKSGQGYYVLVLEKSDDQNYYLRKVKVNIGRVSMGFTEITESEVLEKVVVQGVYNLSAE